MQIYDVFINSEVVGKVNVKTEGLYVCFLCRCTFSGRGIYRLIACIGSECIDLGICVPEGDCLVAERRIPRKQLCGEISHFYLESHAIERTYDYVAVNQDSPFENIENLIHAHIEIQNGKCVIAFPPSFRSTEQNCLPLK